jgi:hypothetical protein
MELKDKVLEFTSDDGVLYENEQLATFIEDYAIRFSNWLDKNYIKKKGAYYHKGDWEFSNGENNKKKLLHLFNRNVE